MTNEHIAEHLNGLALECEKLSEHAESFRTEQELLSAAAYLYDTAQEIAASGPPLPARKPRATGNGAAR